ncbi:YceI family protein [uncultured Wocania sp.]|uniref:YceI family protein n=1 Tax=uncultured Wocania sp. TaxID=2834404 RepID=UPI0030F6535F
MKKIALVWAQLIFCSIVGFSQQEISINTKTSIVNWKGSMLFSFGGHHGTVNFKSGNIIKTNDKITGGNFTVDMSSIINTDGDYSEDLVNHLKNEDFFNVEKHPTATLVIDKVEYHKSGQLRMHANLTIKGITKPILFDAKLNSDNTKLTAKFKIDRTDWNIVYGAKGIVKVKDYAISDAIEFEVKLNLK